MNDPMIITKFQYKEKHYFFSYIFTCIPFHQKKTTPSFKSCSVTIFTSKVSDSPPQRTNSPEVSFNLNLFLSLMYHVKRKSYGYGFHINCPLIKNMFKGCLFVFFSTYLLGLCLKQIWHW